jgi:uncharacterized protein YqeY
MSTKLIKILKDSLIESIKLKDKESITATRLVIDAINNYVMSYNKKVISDNDVIHVCSNMKKEFTDCMNIYSKITDNDNAIKNFNDSKNIVKICEFVLPNQISEYELEREIKICISNNILTDIKGMSVVKNHIISKFPAGTYDMRSISEIFRRLINN